MTITVGGWPPLATQRGEFNTRQESAIAVVELNFPSGLHKRAQPVAGLDCCIICYIFSFVWLCISDFIIVIKNASPARGCLLDPRLTPLFHRVSF